MLLNKPDLVTFDPSIKAHRAAVKAFLVRNAWSDAKIRFNYDPGYGSVADMVQAKLIEWYVAKENFEVKPKPIRRKKPLGKGATSKQSSILGGIQREVAV